MAYLFNVDMIAILACEARLGSTSFDETGPHASHGMRDSNKFM